MRTIAAVLLLTACDACSSDGGSAVDATPTVDIDNGMCGADLRFTGELVDADSTLASFCGVNGARVEAGTAMSTTAPNGRFDLCIPRGGVTNVTVTPSATASGCTSMPGTYTMPAIAVGSTATIQAGAFFSAKMITMQRLATLAPGADMAKAHVMVHVEGNQRAVAILAGHGTAQAYNGTAWAAGEQGTDVFFPNVDVGNGTTMLTAVGGAIGTGPIPLQAGKLTLVTLLAK